MKLRQQSTEQSLELLQSEAQSLFNEAKELRKEMDNLPSGDPSRNAYEKAIRTLLENSRKLSATLKSTASSS